MGVYKSLLLKRSNLAYLRGEKQACGHKVKYISYEKARKHGYRINTAEDNTHTLVPYLCAYCGCWHLGREMDDRVGNVKIQLPEKIIEKINKVNV
jgi:hypothetical protein